MGESPGISESHLSLVRKRYLIVDDIPVVRDILTSFICRTMDAVCFQAENGVEALEIAVKELPDLILLDINMPDMSGFDVLSRLRENTVCAGIPVIIITVQSEIAYMRKALLLGVRDYLCKPITSDELMNSMERVMNKKASP